MAQEEGENKLTIAKVNRKIAKPIMEKKRRARINASLNELKNLLVEVLQKEGCRHSSKMEKADILEMAVRHLKNLQRQQAMNTSYQSVGMREAFPVKEQQCEISQQVGNQFSLSEKFHADQKSTNNIVVPQPIKLDIKTGLPMTMSIQQTPTSTAQLPNTISPICQPLMTRTPNGELAVLLPQTLLNQKQISGDFVLPLYTIPPVTLKNQTGDKIPSSAPLSPVWRPW